MGVDKARGDRKSQTRGSEMEGEAKEENGEANKRQQEGDK